MSYQHFECAREIWRVLKDAPLGLTRAKLFEAVILTEKSERIFGETLSEMCQGNRNNVICVREPGTFTLYRLRADAPAELPKKAPPAVKERKVVVPRPTSTPSSHELRCQCGGPISYSGRGRPPALCDNCKARSGSMKCPTCGRSMRKRAA